MFSVAVNTSKRRIANHVRMGQKTIPDDELTRDADRVTIWIASPPAPRDVWSLRDALCWAAGRGPVTLHRPSREDRPAAWVDPEQVARLAEALQQDDLTLSANAH